MFRHLTVTVLVLLLLTSLALAERQEVKAIPNDYRQSVDVSTTDRTVITFEIGAYDRIPVDVNGDTYYQISFQKSSNLMIEGEPSLPKINRSIIIPDDAEMQINVLSSEYVDIPETPVAPSKGKIYRKTDPSSIPFVKGPIYNSGVWYPTKLASLRRPFIMRDYRGTVIDLNPFQYNPATKTLRVYTSVTVEVVPVGIGRVNVLDRKGSPRKVIPEFEQLYERRFLNFDGLALPDYEPTNSTSDLRYSSVGEAGDMLIITYDAFNSYVQPLVDWKMQKGIRTTVVDVSTIGNNYTDIKAYIQAFYDNPAYNLGWVLLVGDAAQVATGFIWGGASDPSYSKLAGDDDYPDIFVGRFSAESSGDVETQVTRTINYEKYPSGTDWFHKATGIGSDQGAGIGHDGGEIDYEHIEFIRQDLLGFTYTDVDAIYDPGATHYDVSAAINDGRSFINYAGHGSTTSWTTSSFSNYYVNLLTNENELPFVVSVGCVNGEFTGGTVCFAETWLRATNGGQPTGAIAAYMSSINQSWSPPMDAQDEITDLLIAKEKTTIGGLSYNGSCHMIDLNGIDGVEMFDTWHIFGDPSVLMWTDTPQPLSVFHNSAILSGQSSFDVEVVGHAGALCALYADGILFGSSFTDEFGLTSIPIGTIPSPGETLTLTVTAFNGQPYMVDLDVTAASGALVTFDSYSPNDFYGNNNGHVDAGEQVLLNTQLKNIGLGDALGVEATLSSTDPYVTINDNYEYFGDILGGNGTAYVADAYNISVDVNTPDNYNIAFHLEMSSSEPANWSSDFSIPIHKPELGYLSLVINDATGNGNGVLDPGETAEFIVTVENNGSGLAGSVNGLLSESDAYVTVDDPDGIFGDIPANGGSADNSFNTFLVSADGSLGAGYPVTLDLTLTDGNGYEVTVHFDIIVGDRENIFFDDFSSNKGWTGLGGEAEWTIGPVNGGIGSDIYGSPDPEIDTSPTEDNGVLGNDLTGGTGGDYNSQIAGIHWVYSPMFDCTDYQGVQLIFNRWLGVESYQYDGAYIEVYNGSYWSRIFSNATTYEDVAWHEMLYNISAIADGNPNVQVRFGLGPTDTYWQYCGWNIDDFAIKGYYQGGSGNPAAGFDPGSLSATVYDTYSGYDTLHITNTGDAILRIRFTGDAEWISCSGDLNYIPPGESFDFEVVFNEVNAPVGENSGNLEFSSNEQQNRSGLIPVSLTVMEAYMCGDADSDNDLTILDIVYLINYKYKKGAEPVPWECGDVNFDHDINILDIIKLIDYLYKDGDPLFCAHNF